MKKNKLQEIVEGHHKIEEEERLRFDQKPSEIPPLPKGKAALTPTTKAGWQTEGIIRAIISNLHNGKDWEKLFIYGGSGKVMRNWKAYYETMYMLQSLESNETLFMQSGVPYGKTITHQFAPRCVVTNSVIVPNWTQSFQEMVDAGLSVYGQMTAGSWIFIGLQGIIQGTYETMISAIKSAEKTPNFNKLTAFEQNVIVTAGLGLMGGAQALAIKMVGKIALIAEIDPTNLDRMFNEGRDEGTPYLDIKVDSIEEGVKIAREYALKDEPTSIGILCNAVELLEYLTINNITPHVLTDQTSAHDMLNGYVPANMTYEEAVELRKINPKKYKNLAFKTVKTHVELMVELQKRGAETFDYGNNIRTQAFKEGYKEAYKFTGFVPKYIRPLFCEGKGPFRWAALSNNPKDILITDKYAKRLFHDDPMLLNWIDLASKYIPFEKGLPARVFWAGYKGRAAFGMLLNKLYSDGAIDAPVIIGRDHLDGGSVASPYRETEGMKDGSDAIGDYPVLNLLGNSLSGATWVSYHGGGGVGVGYSLHAGQVCVADGTPLAQERLFRVLTWDPMSAVLRHAAAGYEKSLKFATTNKILVPGITKDQNVNYHNLYEELVSLVKRRTEIDLFPPSKNLNIKFL
ncbi:urocanate hydratase [Candidatus Heimdallarchaeota archaeon B3_Heim]|nr:MAG: urocanate hydratase [Candidatus Heimdallarchaeota archaeon B3_Heim]